MDQPNAHASQEIAEHKGITSFWVDSAARIDVANNKLLHKTGWGELKETANWLCEGPLTIGITSGASTPDGCVLMLALVLASCRQPLRRCFANLCLSQGVFSHTPHFTLLRSQGD